MGMDLVSRNVEPLHYNWTEWHWLKEHLESWGVDTGELVENNDGELISEPTCKAIANAIESHLNDLSDKDRKWIKPHIQEWRESGGFKQF